MSTWATPTGTGAVASGTAAGAGPGGAAMTIIQASRTARRTMRAWRRGGANMGPIMPGIAGRSTAFERAGLSQGPLALRRKNLVHRRLVQGRELGQAPFRRRLE